MILFEVKTALGTNIRTTEAYWAKLITLKHPSTRGQEDAVQEALRSPEQARRSKVDPQVLLYYRTAGIYYVCVVVKVLNGDGFIITAYKTPEHKRRRQDMAQVKVYYDREGKTLTVWFDDPQKEHVCEETGEEVILMKDAAGTVIGFERLNFVLEKEEGGFSFEAVAV